MNLRRLALNAVSLAAGGVVAQVCFLSIEAVIARRLGEASYGAYGTVYAIALAIAVVADMGMNWKLIEDGSREPAAVPTVLGTTLVLKLVFCAAIYPLALLLLPLAGYDEGLVRFFSVFYIYAALLVVQETLAARNAVHHRIYISAMFQGVCPLLILGGVLAVTSFAPQLRPVGWAYVAASALVTGVWMIVTIVGERPRVELRSSLRLLRGSYLYGISSTLYQIGIRIDLILLSLLRDLPTVGLFAAADKLADLGTKVGVMGSRLLSPSLFAQSRHEPDAYRKSCKVILRGVSVLGVLGCLALALLAGPLLALAFGAPFRAAAATLALLALALLARLVSIVMQMILSASGQHLRRTGSHAIALGISIGTALALIPPLGIIGAALARVVSEWFYVGAMLTGRRLPIPRGAAAGWILGPFAVGAAAYGFAQVAAADAALRLAAGLAFYGLGLLGARIVQVRELRTLGSLLMQAARA